MAEFDALIEAQIRGARIGYVELVRFDFKSGEIRVHNGFGPFADGNGERWLGLGGLGQMGPINVGSGQAIVEVVFSLTGDAAILANLEADAEESAGREVSRYLQFCDVRGVDEAGRTVLWNPIDAPFQIFWGTMGALKVSRSAVQAGAGAPAAAQRVVSVPAFNAFINRRKPASGFFSFRDQAARSPGDQIFVSASAMADATASWPHGLS